MVYVGSLKISSHK